MKTDVNYLARAESFQHPRPLMPKLIRWLKYSSCVCTVIGGSLLASKTVYSPYGFLLLASGSSQMVLAGWLMRDRSVVCYSGAIFIFVDAFGVYRWLMVG